MKDNMARTIVFVGANIQPSLYENLRKKYPNESDTSLLVKGLNFLLEYKESKKNINLEMMKQEVWNNFIKKSQTVNISIENIVGELIYRWVQGEFKLWDEKS